MAETSFQVKYDGDAVRDGRMPVRDLAPALLSLGQLFTDASLLLYPDNDPVALEIEATKEGSFNVDLILQAAGMGWDQLSSLTLEEGLASLYVFKDLVIGGSADMSLFGLVRWLKGGRVEGESDGPEPGKVTLKAGDSAIVVRAEVANLNRDRGIRKKLREVVEPLYRDGVDLFEIRSDEEPAVELDERDAPAFDLPDSEDEDIVSDQEIEVYLEVLTADLETGAGRKWRFGGLGGKFMATIEDTAFLEKVAMHEEQFGTGDQLHAVVQVIQRRDPSSGRIRTEHRILKVLGSIEAPEQLAMEERVERFQGGRDEPPQLGPGDSA